ncbi:MAG: Uma2 family endonuclease [Thiolinea sp.]
MPAKAHTRTLTPEQYLAAEKTADYRSEYIEGEVYAMAGASDANVTLSTNLSAMLHGQLRGSDCKSYSSDMKLRIGEDKTYFYPDLMVSCDAEDRKRKYFKCQPILVVEILSDNTEAYDRGSKFAWYRQLDSLQEYVLIDQNQFRVELFRRNAHNRWELFSFEGESALLELQSVGLRCSLAELYEDVDFDLV